MHRSPDTPQNSGSGVYPEEETERHAGRMTVYRILRSSGLDRPLQTVWVKRTYTRWQSIHSSSLWQCRLKVVGTRWRITILDDHSRFVTASHIFKEGNPRELVIWLLDRAIRDYAKPKEIPTDHGSQFWSV